MISIVSFYGIMMNTYHEDALANCPHCDRKGWAFEHALEETEHFVLICDSHPLLEGHLLIIPKRHVSCIGEYTPAELSEFLPLYAHAKRWVKEQYGSVATFEHGVLGQTVFHSHIHFLPFTGQVEDIIPEGKKHLYPLSSIESLVALFEKDKQYLFFEVGSKLWTVDPALGYPRFFRERFAQALGCPERANWKETRNNPQLLASGAAENDHCRQHYLQG